MSALDDLKQGSSNNVKKISINNIVNNDNAKPESQTPSVKSKSEVRTLSVAEAQKLYNGNKKQAGDDSEHNTTGDYIMDLVNPEDPNSLLSEYLARKREEASEWIAKKEEEREEAEFEDKFGDEKDETSSSDDEEDEDDEEEEEDLNNPKMIPGEVDTGEEIMFDMTGFSDDDDEEEVIDSTMTTGQFSTPDDQNEEIVLGSVTTTYPEDPQDEYSFEDESTDDGDEEEDDEPVDEIDEKPVKKAEPVVEKKEAPKKDEFISGSGIDIEVGSTDKGIEVEDDEEDTVNISDEENDDEDEYIKKLRQVAKDRLKPVNLDLSTFTIAKKPKINIKDDVIKSYKAKVAHWVLWNQKASIQIKEFSGSELELMNEYYNASRRSTDSLKRLYNMIYEHIVSAKPQNFETWLKLTPLSDLDNYFFAIYIASYDGANYIPIECSNDKCGKSFITDNINIMDQMVKFNSKESKKEFADIYRSSAPLQTTGRYVSEIFPLTESFAIGFKEPTLWDRVEMSMLDDDTRTKYSSIIEFVPYIDSLYLIDMNSQELVPITYKTWKGEDQKNIRSRIRKFNQIFSSISSDQFTPVRAYITDIDSRTNKSFKYVLPEVTCPECGHVNAEVEIPFGSMADLVFTRYRLGTLVTTSIN